jgi:hypothetical protein
MAVCAHELALGDLIENSPLAVRPPKTAQLRRLIGSGKVIPLHDGGRKDDSAVGAWLAVFE